MKEGRDRRECERGHGMEGVCEGTGRTGDGGNVKGAKKGI